MADAATYGAKAMKLLAIALGCSKSALYAASRLAACWTKRELDDILARPTLHRRPLSYSHLLILASVSNAKKREALMEAAITQGLRVLALQRLVDGRSTPVSTRHPNHVAQGVVAKHKAWSKWIVGLAPDVLARRETRAILATAAVETRAFLRHLEAAVGAGPKLPADSGAKSAKGKGGNAIFQTSGKSVLKVFGGPGEEADGET